MPLYSIECPMCGNVDEFLQGCDDAYVDVSCMVCGTITNRHKSRAWSHDKISISGDTCSGSCNFSEYFDVGMGAYVKSREHRKRLMREKGLTEWSPDPITSKYHEESRYIRDHAPAGDPTARAAAKEQGRLADKARKKNVLDKHLAKARESLKT